MNIDDIIFIVFIGILPYLFGYFEVRLRNKRELQETEDKIKKLKKFEKFITNSKGKKNGT